MEYKFKFPFRYYKAWHGTKSRAHSWIVRSQGDLWTDSDRSEDGCGLTRLCDMVQECVQIQFDFLRSHWLLCVFIVCRCLWLSVCHSWSRLLVTNTAGVWRWKRRHRQLWMCSSGQNAPQWFHMQTHITRVSDSTADNSCSPNTSKQLCATNKREWLTLRLVTDRQAIMIVLNTPLRLTSLVLSHCLTFSSVLTLSLVFSQLSHFL